MSESVLIRFMPYLHPIDVLAKLYIRFRFLVKKCEFRVFLTGQDAKIVSRKHGINQIPKNLESASKIMSEKMSRVFKE